MKMDRALGTPAYATHQTQLKEQEQVPWQLDSTTTTTVAEQHPMQCSYWCLRQERQGLTYCSLHEMPR